MCNKAACAWEQGDCAYAFSCEWCKFVRLYTPCSYWKKSEIFDDLCSIQPCCSLQVNKVTVSYTADYIAAIKTDYTTFENDFEKPNKGNTTETLQTTSITFASDEYIIGVSGRTGWVLNQITFVTNKGRTLEAGTHDHGKPFVVDIPLTYHVVGFGGSKRDYIDTLFIYIREYEGAACDCDTSIVGDGKCDVECHSEQCNWDNGDCDPDPDCHCTKDQLLNQTCDPECNYEACWFDLDACEHKGCKCEEIKLGDGKCDWMEICNNPECLYDKGDCEIDGCHCNQDLLGDGTCDESCYNADCHMDKGDCGDSKTCDACRFASVGPIGAEGKNFDDIFDSQIPVCCDIKIVWKEIPTNDDGKIAGISTSYNYNYDFSEIVDNFNPNVYNPGDFLNIMDQEGEIIIKVEGKFEDDDEGCAVWLRYTIKTADGERQVEFGDVNSELEAQVLKLSEKYPALAFFGTYSDKCLTGLGVYAWSVPDQGCKCPNFQDVYDTRYCDLECYKPECLFSMEMCEDCDACSVYELYNTQCDPHCNIADCEYDRGNCPDLPDDCTCPVELYLNDTCDLVCNNAECKHDNGNCEYKGCQCPQDIHGDGTCNPECNTFECFWDAADCLTDYKCKDCKFKEFTPEGNDCVSQNFFDDLAITHPCCQIDIMKVEIWVFADSHINRIRTTYLVNGKEQAVETAKGSVNEDLELHTFTLAEGEIITNVAGTFETYLNSIEFTTSTDRVVTIGKTIGTVFVLDVHEEDDYKFVGFNGFVCDHVNKIGGSYIIIDACKATECTEAVFRNNGQCDYEYCYNEICGYDWSECEYDGCPCDIALLFNDQCDKDCNRAECDNDNGDCEPYGGCYHCELEQLGNGTCERACNNLECKFDGDDCYEGCDCDKSILGDGNCDYEECYTPECHDDKSDCDYDCECTVHEIYDGECQYWCNKPGCIYDNGSCDIDGCYQCDNKLVGDGNCDPDCNVEDCNFDGGDCKYDGCQCTDAELEQCLEKCDNLVCKYGDGNCGDPNECDGCRFKLLPPLGINFIPQFEFDDFDTIDACCSVRIEQIDVLVSNFNTIVGFRTIYVLDYGIRVEVADDSLKDKYPDGAPLPAGYKYETFNFAVDEAIIEVSGSSSETIETVTFVTNKGNTYTAGNKSSNASLDQVITITEEYQIIGFKGGYSPDYDALNFFLSYIRTNPHQNECECGDGFQDNQQCDYPQCWTKKCGYDAKDCDFDGCPEECTVPEMFDEVCNLECNLLECNNHDNEKCIPDCDCLPGVIGDGTCNLYCNTEPCSYDGGDCPYDGCQCGEELGDGTCNSECFSRECIWDNYDCTTSFDCSECKYLALGPEPAGDAVVTFDDVETIRETGEEVCCQIWPTEVNLYFDNQCIYRMDTNYLVDGTDEYEVRNGDQSRDVNAVTLVLQPLEYVVAIEGSTDGDKITSLKLTTNTGQSAEVGTPTANKFNFAVEEGKEFNLVAFFGTFLDESCLTNIGVYYQIVDACTCDRSLNNDECDYEQGCYTKFCGYDWGDCDFDGCDCDLATIYNGVCDLECNTEPCRYDDGSCTIDGCTKCDLELLDDVCQQKCNVEECRFDNDECYEDCECDPDIIGDGICHPECYTLPCYEELGDCDYNDECKEKCSFEDYWNDTCEQNCNIEVCAYDNGNCEPYPGCDECDYYKLGNGECQIECNIEKCFFDGGDCEPYPGCKCDFENLVGNGECNQVCDNMECDYDNDECDPDPVNTPCDVLCRFHKVGPVGGTDLDKYYDMLRADMDVCCDAFIRAIEYGGDDKLHTILIYIEKDMYTEVVRIGFDDDVSDDLTYDRIPVDGKDDSKNEIDSGLADAPSTSGTYVFEDFEFITKIEGTASSVITSIYFTTNNDVTFGETYATSVRKFKIDLRNRFGTVSFFGYKDSTNKAISSLGLWVIRLIFPRPECTLKDKIGDGVCDYDDNYNRLCLFDGGDCEIDEECDCELSEIYNGVCDYKCNYDKCKFDNGDCPDPGCTCDPLFKTDDVCTPRCNTEACKYDPDCPVDGCSGCTQVELEDGVCQDKCDTIDCVWDLWDCTDSYECEDCRYEHVFSCKNEIPGFNDALETEVCCQLEHEASVFFFDGTHISGLVSTYTNDGEPYSPGLRGSESIPIDVHTNPGEWLHSATGTSDGEHITSLLFVTSTGREIPVGSPKPGDSTFDLSLLKDMHDPEHRYRDYQYRAVAFTGTIMYGKLTCFGLLYQIYDACPCGDAEKANGKCDPQCWVPECGNDWGQCKDCDCDKVLLADGECHPECNTEGCSYDGGDCTEVEGCTLCTEDILGDGKCDLKCNYEECNHDNGDCKKDCFCDHSLLDNGKCDLSCNTEPCGYDECIPGCDCWEELHDGCCTDKCNTSACHWDNGECTESFSCRDCEYASELAVGKKPSGKDFDEMLYYLPCCDVYVVSVEGSTTIDQDTNEIVLSGLRTVLNIEGEEKTSTYGNSSTGFSGLTLDLGDQITEVYIKEGTNFIQCLWLVTLFGEEAKFGYCTEDGLHKVDIPTGHFVVSFRGNEDEDGIRAIGVYIPANVPAIVIP